MKKMTPPKTRVFNFLFKKVFWMGGLPTSVFQSMFGGHRGYNLGFCYKEPFMQCTTRGILVLKKHMDKLLPLFPFKCRMISKGSCTPSFGDKDNFHKIHPLLFSINKSFYFIDFFVKCYSTPLMACWKKVVLAANLAVRLVWDGFKLLPVQ